MPTIAHKPASLRLNMDDLLETLSKSGNQTFVLKGDVATLE